MMKPNFTVAEFKERLAKTKERMEAEGIDVLLLTNPANMSYLTGYDAWSFYVHQMVAVMIDEDQPYWIGRGIDAAGARFTTYLDDDHIIDYPDNYVQSTVRHPMDFVCEYLKGRNLGNKTIAVELDTYYFTAQCYIKLTEGLPNATFKNGTNLVNWIRVVKSDAEIEIMKRAGVLADKSMQAAIDKLAAGVRECDVVADATYASIVGTEEFGGDYPAHVPLLPNGEQVISCHHTWSDDVLQEGPAIIELAGNYKRYNVPLARTFSIGKPSDKLREIADVVVEGATVALDSVRPGVTAEEVEMAWRKYITKKGFEKDSRLGYSIGLNFPPSWGEETISIRPGDKTVLQPNMTLHMVPALWVGNVGVLISASFRVTETGHEVFSELPRELIIK